MKDPAVLFYFQDFLVGTEFMTDDEAGKYIRILCHLADKGSLCKTQLLRICKTTTIPEAINEKLLIDEDGNYYQRRMREERAKRMSYSESRRNNRIRKEDKICKTYDKHMENENENEDINKDEKRKEKRVKFIIPTIEEVEIYFCENGYSQESAVKAYNYYAIADWHDSKGNKIRNWKQKMQAVWFKDENRIKSETVHRVIGGYYED